MQKTPTVHIVPFLLKQDCRTLHFKLQLKEEILDNTLLDGTTLNIAVPALEIKKENGRTDSIFVADGLEEYVWKDLSCDAQENLTADIDGGSKVGNIPYCNEANSTQEVCNGKTKLEVNKCSYCEYTTQWTSTLQRHIFSVHKKGKPFKCNECDFDANEKVVLNNHLSVAHGRFKSYRCSLCIYSASKKWFVTRHFLSVHEKHRPFKCAQCNFASSDKGGLSKHIKKVHNRL